MSNSAPLEYQQWANISATTAAFQLKGGQYALVATATWSAGNVELEVLADDGSTYIVVPNSNLTADGFVVFSAPPGTYRLLVATSTAVYASVREVRTKVA